MDTEGLPGCCPGTSSTLRWDDVAERCLACGNCTLVCPTCFCSTVWDSTDLDGTIVREPVVGILLRARPLLPLFRPGAMFPWSIASIANG